jgi:protein-S-isoprenylcysteine O-methyltransferase Ste14
MNEPQLSRWELLKLVLVRFGAGIVGLGLLLFLSAGTTRYWPAWLWLATLILPMIGVLVYLLRNDPALLERRMRFREKEQQQRLLIGLGWIWLLAAFTLPGFDHRFGWSHVPTPVVLLGDLGVFLGYVLFILVMRENSYASRVVEVQEGQKVISSGPYAFVRHPLYASSIVLYGFTPLALGSYWTIIPAVLIIPLMIWRIIGEERLLMSQLPGYPEYVRKVRYRLIPRLW